jgi:hypothetical protein
VGSASGLAGFCPSSSWLRGLEPVGWLNMGSPNLPSTAAINGPMHLVEWVSVEGGGYSD